MVLTAKLRLDVGFAARFYRLHHKKQSRTRFAPSYLFHIIILAWIAKRYSIECTF